MIAQDELIGADMAAVEVALTAEPLASAASQTIVAFGATTEMLTHMGELVVDYGVGKPLAVFRDLLATYRALLSTQAAISHAAQTILTAAENASAGS
jgi:hypothetical protein